jgi:hypothetical protein
MTDGEKRAHIRVMTSRALLDALEAAALLMRDGYTRELRAGAEETRDMLRDEIMLRVGR